MPADTDSGPQDFHARMRIGDFYCLVNVHTETLRNHREFVRQGDVDVPVRILHDLDQLRCHIVREEDLSLYEGLVDSLRPFASLFGERPYHSVVFHDFLKDVRSGQCTRPMSEFTLSPVFFSTIGVITSRHVSGGTVLSKITRFPCLR